VNSPCSVVSRERLREETMKRPVLRLAAVIGAATVSALAVSPAFAAATVSQATASALNITLAGKGGGTGIVTAKNNGSVETKTGTTNPPIQILGSQAVVNEGVLAQEAQARSNGTSAACAGLAGQGGSVAQVGKSSCLTPGAPIDLALGSIDLNNVELIVPGSALDPLVQANVIPQLLAQQLITPLSNALAATPLGTTGISATRLDAVAGYCRAAPGSTTANADIADLQVVADLGGQKITLLDFPASVAPKPGGTDLLIDLDKVGEALLGTNGAITTELTNALAAPGVTGPLAQLAALTPQVQAEVIQKVVDGLRDPLLTQLSENVLKVTLNNRTFGDGGTSVHETALDIQALPVAADSPLGTSLASVTIGDVNCGPNQAPGAEAGSPHCANPPCDGNLPDIPTVVDSGVAGHADHTARNVLGATAALMLLAGTAGLAGYRRMLNK
jgi:hypothetical protein